MIKRQIAEKALSKFLNIKGIVKPNDALSVKRLDFGQDWNVFVNGSAIGKVKYSESKNRYLNFKSTIKKFNHRVIVKEFNCIDYLKANKVSIKR